MAGEVVKGPFEAAKINVKKYGLDNSIDVKLGNGLEVLDQENNIDSITICGMGGPLIASIIEKVNQNYKITLDSFYRAISKQLHLDKLYQILIII